MAFFNGFLAEGTGTAIGFQENTTSGYARVPVTMNNLQGGQTSIQAGVTFATNANATITQRALYDAATGGNLIMWWMTPSALNVTTAAPDVIVAGALLHTFPGLSTNGPGAGATPAEFAAGSQIGTTGVGNPIFAGVALEATNGAIYAAPASAALAGALHFNRVVAADAAYAMPSTGWSSSQVNLIAFPALTAARAVTLPSAASVAGKVFMVVDEAGTAGTNNITFTGTIAGATNKSIAANYGNLKFYSNGVSFQSWQ